MTFPAWADEKPQTELRDLFVTRVDGVGRPAHQRDFIIAKGADDSDLRENVRKFADQVHTALLTLSKDENAALLTEAAVTSLTALAESLGVKDVTFKMVKIMEPALNGPPKSDGKATATIPGYQPVPNAKTPSSVFKATTAKAGDTPGDDEDGDEGIKLTPKTLVAAVKTALTELAKADEPATTERPRSKQDATADEDEPAPRTVKKGASRMGSGVFRSTFFPTERRR